MNLECHLLSEDDVIVHQDLGQCHGVLDVDIVVLGAVDQHHPAGVNEVSRAGDAGAAAMIVGQYGTLVTMFMTHL